MQNKEQKETKDLPDEQNPAFIFSSTKSELLSEILNGKIDIIDIAKKEMQNRGLDINCKFNHEIKLESPPIKSKFYNYFDKIIIETADGCFICDVDKVDRYPDINTFIIGDESKCIFLIYGNFPNSFN